MKYDIEMASSCMIHIPNFVTVSTGIQKLLGEG
jgi:hypothetical protein